MKRNTSELRGREGERKERGRQTEFHKRQRLHLTSSFYGEGKDDKANHG